MKREGYTLGVPGVWGLVSAKLSARAQDFSQAVSSSLD